MQKKQDAKKPDLQSSYLRSKFLDRATKRQQLPKLASYLSLLLPYFPTLKSDLEKAAMYKYTPISFIFFALKSSVMLTLALLVITYLFLANSENLISTIVLLFPVFLIFTFIYSMMLPKVKARVRARTIDSELLFAGRHLLIGIRAGIPIFEAISAITKDYGEVSKEFSRIIEKISLGTSASVAMHEVANSNASQMFRRVIMQLVNSMSSGSDVGDSLDAVLEQISREQVISLKEYGQKLNPIVMFFMVFGVIFPSLGVALLVILLSFIGGGAVVDGFVMLSGLFVLILLLQFVFLTMAESTRPKFRVV